MRFDMKGLVGGGVMCLMATAAAPQSKTDTDWATNELSSEMIECGQYFLTFWACFREFPSQQAQATANTYRQASDQISQRAFEIGKSVGLSVEALAARMRLANESLSKEINKNCTNFSVLQERYGTFCKNLNDNSDQRFRELVQCSINKTALPCGGH
jgi:hypothetical protein